MLYEKALNTISGKIMNPTSNQSRITSRKEGERENEYCCKLEFHKGN